jgi:UDP-N-acetylglucosamine diphosphorylase/glucosamine-1-phosphate N-acetyltransferase
MASLAPIAIILAAGKGTRMKSDLPKVLHPVGGRPMVHCVVDACRAAGCKRIILVVGYKHELVEATFHGTIGIPQAMGVEFVLQTEQLGTGHAVEQARPLLKNEMTRPGQPVLVLAGDGPLIRPETLTKLLQRHTSTGAAATLATSVIDDPTGYGRIVRDSDGTFTAIVEQKELSPQQTGIREVNPSYYCFDGQALFQSLAGLKRNEQSGEYYITDVPAMLLAQGKCVEVIDAVPPEDVLSINTPEQLAQVDAIYRSRTIQRRSPASSPTNAAGRTAS